MVKKSAAPSSLIPSALAVVSRPCQVALSWTSSSSSVLSLSLVEARESCHLCHLPWVNPKVALVLPFPS